jgi:hypothetical protein
MPILKFSADLCHLQLQMVTREVIEARRRFCDK